MSSLRTLIHYGKTMYYEKKNGTIWKNYDTQENYTLLKTNFVLLWKKTMVL